MLKSFIRNQLTRLGLDVRRSSQTTSVPAFLHSRGIELVFDVGANIGQYGAALFEGGYSGKIQSFEPNPAAFASLEKAAARNSNWTVENAGLGDATGELSLNVSEYDVFSSFLPVTAAAAAFDTRSRAIRQVTVPVKRLDAYTGLAMGKRVFIKMDTQGFERNILAGGGAVLQNAFGVQLELPLLHLYQDVWSIEEALAQMKTYGFVPAQFHPVNPITKDPASMAEIDCVFRRLEP